MSAPSDGDREYAYFSVSGSGDHSSITTQLRMEPSEAWNVGDPVRETRRCSNSMVWRLDSGLDDRQRLSHHIDALMTILSNREEELRQLWIDYDLLIQCVGYYQVSGHGVHLDREVVRQAARLGIAFDFDFYYLGPHDVERLDI